MLSRSGDEFLVGLAAREKAEAERRSRFPNGAVSDSPIGNRENEKRVVEASGTQTQVRIPARPAEDPTSQKSNGSPKQPSANAILFAPSIVDSTESENVPPITKPQTQVYHSAELGSPSGAGLPSSTNHTTEGVPAGTAKAITCHTCGQNITEPAGLPHSTPNDLASPENGPAIEKDSERPIDRSRQREPTGNASKIASPRGAQRDEMDGTGT
jgi:hypothetical protein